MMMTTKMDDVLDTTDARDSKAVTTRLIQKAIRLLARRDHSTSELKSKLQRYGGYNSEIWTDILGFLESKKLLCKEEDLVERYVNQWRKEGRGRYWIKGKLATKGLKDPLLRDDDNERQAAEIFLKKRRVTLPLKSVDLATKSRLARALVSRGFSPSLVATLMR